MPPKSKKTKKLFHTYCQAGAFTEELAPRATDELNPHTDEVKPLTTRSWFYATELASIYKFPTPSPTAKPVVGVLSFGGGLFGTLSGGGSGILTNGDCQAYWTACGIQSSNFPTVFVQPIGGATNNPADAAGTAENTLDVQTIGGVCPTSNLTIILYIVPNSLSSFVPIMDYALNSNVIINGSPVKPNILSISWGAPELYYSASLLSSINTRFAAAVSRGINICVATGDYGSSNGIGSSTSSYADFPSSSPNVVACGGTRLVCPNRVYDSNTVETGWSSGGGAASAYFPKPAYQSSKVPGTLRRNVDVASVADPATGVFFIVNGQNVVYGGTSVSAPTVAGFLATFNSSNWANPVFYTAAHSNYNDILVGNNGAYSAGAGWDNVTGLGSLKGSNLAPLIQNPPPPPVLVASVALNASSVALNRGATYQATATISPANADNQAVTWSSTATSVATVNSSGLVTAVGNGTTTIRVTTQDGNKTAALTVTVTTAVTGVTLNRSTLSLRRNTRQTLIATVSPTNASNRTVTWSSSNTAVAAVSTTGIVTAKTRGTTTITVRTNNGGFTRTCAVTVV